MKKSARLLFVLLFLMTAIIGCNGKKEEPEVKKPQLLNCPTNHEMEFGGVYIETTIDDFNKLGFKYGDAIKIEFSNGYVLEDLPYYNGYYVDAGQLLLVGYPGYDYIKATANYGDDLWITAGIKEDTTASIYLVEEGKYLDNQKARDIHYTDYRKDYPSDEVFANFRNVVVGNIKPGVFYRSASPCDNQHNRAPYVDKLCAEAGINFIMNLADNDAKIQKYINAEDFDSPHFLELYNNGQVELLAMSMNFNDDDFKQKIVEGLNAVARVALGFTAASNSNGPYLVHCTEGKDRTGFICMLIEALCGASYQELVDDYMLTYDNYYKINLQKDPEKYHLILEKNLVPMIKALVNDDSVDITTADLSVYVRNYLIRIGMSETAIDRLISKFCD